MKYIILIITIVFLAGCSSSDSERMNREMQETKKSVDSLKSLYKTNDATLDSLKKQNQLREEQLKYYQQMLDSLNKNLKEEESK